MATLGRESLDIPNMSRDVLIAPSPPWSGKSCRLHSVRESRAASTTVAMKWFLVAPSPPRSGNSRFLHLGRESLERGLFDPTGQAGRAVAFWVAPFPESRRIHFGRESPENPFWKSRRLHVGLESRAVSILVCKVAPFPLWSGNSRRFRLCRKELILGRAISASVWKVAPHAPWSGLSHLWLLKSRRIHHGRKELFLSRAVSASVWKVAPSPPWSRKSWKGTFWSHWPGCSRGCFLSRAVSTLVAKALKTLFESRAVSMLV